ncbi:alpha/beta fold hydrolase [Paracoccus shanxieyensis]|uniref:Alpha/beta fold hydrolase n=1 Tax=Paracoccus shanxieyensis TaxID=2675752 RepID=A0A6L6J0W9_9RHOB|nr:alpha/beta fold hydrolase [Paracoccus shanxieyensis]MTH64444.1 alpha/beta fold hydrolase [Paracoccus shanxieyensis]MTH87563.1 alpha/beta fold hydrolase [Paracoccus shanxieyensis]
MLNMTEIGSENAGPPVIVAHGLLGSGKNLGGIARRLAESGRRVVLVDMRNHGDSFHDPDHSYAALADDLASVIEAKGSPADVLGHSMGGKAAMMLALTHPDLVRRLMVLDIAPYAYSHTQSGYIDAMEAVRLDGLKLRSQADAQMAENIPEPGVRAFLLQSLDLKSDPPRWRANLTALRDQMSNLVGWPDAPKASFQGPVLFLAGGQSDYCREPQVQAIREYFPQAKIKFLAGAGHWLHADRPTEVADAAAEFMG